MRILLLEAPHEPREGFEHHFRRHGVVGRVCEVVGIPNHTYSRSVLGRYVDFDDPICAAALREEVRSVVFVEFVLGHGDSIEDYGIFGKDYIMGLFVEDGEDVKLCLEGGAEEGVKGGAVVLFGEASVDY